MCIRDRSILGYSIVDRISLWNADCWICCHLAKLWIRLCSKNIWKSSPEHVICLATPDSNSKTFLINHFRCELSSTRVLRRSKQIGSLGIVVHALNFASCGVPEWFAKANLMYSFMLTTHSILQISQRGILYKGWRSREATIEFDLVNCRHRQPTFVYNICMLAPLHIDAHMCIHVNILYIHIWVNE